MLKGLLIASSGAGLLEEELDDYFSRLAAEAAA